MRFTGWFTGVVVGVVCLVQAPDVWAECQLVVQPDFVGEICPNSVPNRCLETNVLECHFGRWLLEEGGVFEGSSKQYFGQTNIFRTRTVRKSGLLQTPSFEGQLDSTAEHNIPLVGPIEYPEFATDETRAGTETLRDGGVFSGTQRTTTSHYVVRSSAPSLTVDTVKDGRLTTDTFTGTMLMTAHQNRRLFSPPETNSSVTTNLNGTWTLAPDQQLEGTLVTSVVNGVTTVTDNRTPLIVNPPETPWQTNAYGTLYTNIAWNYNMGYQFVPQVNGKITKLGGFFNGTKKVRLYDSSGSVLALADVTAANSWGYADITPVQVTAGQTYTVAVNLAGSGGSYRNLGASPLPKIFGKIQILKSVYRASSDLVPTSGSTAYMYG